MRDEFPDEQMLDEEELEGEVEETEDEEEEKIPGLDADEEDL